MSDPKQRKHCQPSKQQMGSNLASKPKADVIKKSKSKTKMSFALLNVSKICCKERKETIENNCHCQALILKYKFLTGPLFLSPTSPQRCFNCTRHYNCSKSYKWNTCDIIFSCVFQCIHSTHTNDLKIVRPWCTYQCAVTIQTAWTNERVSIIGHWSWCGYNWNTHLRINRNRPTCEDHLPLMATILL